MQLRARSLYDLEDHCVLFQGSHGLVRRKLKLGRLIPTNSSSL